MRKTLAAAAFVLAGLTAADVAYAAPTVAQILDGYKAATGGKAWNGKEVQESDYDMIGYGLTGTVHSLTDLKTGRSISDYKLGPTAGAQGFDGVHPWEKDMSGTITLQQGGDAVALAVNKAYRDASKWWRPNRGGAKIVSDGEKTESGQTYDVLTITPPSGKAFDAWFDTKTHFLTRIVEAQGAQTTVTRLSAYRPIGDVILPGEQTDDSDNGEKYLRKLILIKAEFIGAQPDTAFAPPQTKLNDFSIADGAARTVLPIKIINNHLYGEVKINGKGPYVFIFDTGGHAVLTPPLVKELGLKAEGNLPGTGAGEGVMESGFTHVDRLDTGGATLKNQTFLVMPLDKLTEIEGAPVPGMVGFETFRRFVTQIDYGAKTITLIDPKQFDPAGAGLEIPFTFNEHVPEVMGTFEGLPAKFDIDTGSRSELTLTKPFAENNGLRAKHPKGVDAVDGWGVGGPSLGYVTRGAEMTIGPIKIENIVTTLATQSKGAFAGNDYQGNIGGGILKRFVVTFDYGHQKIYLKPLPGPVADTGTFDRAGMWFNVAPMGFVIVNVTKGSAAEIAGLKMGDVITRVDNKPVKEIHLYDLRARLRGDPPGTTVTFKILRNAKTTRFVKIVLRDQI